jgi:uncharacterized protein (TIGR04222 family)
LVWLIVALALFAGAAWYARTVLRAGKAHGHGTPEQGSLDLYHLAYLAGGPGRAADVALLAAWARGAVTIGADGRVSPAGQDPSGDPYAQAVQAALPSGTVAGARVQIAAGPAVRALHDRLFGMGLLNPASRPARLRGARIVLAAAPLVAAAGLFVKPLAGSPTDDTGLWVANLVVVLLGAAGCAVLAYWLFSRFDKLREPLNDRSLFYLWNQVRDPAQLRHIAEAAAGGAHFGETALYGVDRVPDATLGSVFRQAAQVTAGQVVSDGWTEAQWNQSANSRGQLGGPTFTDVQQAASRAAQAGPPPGGPGPQPGPPGFPGQGAQPGMSQYGGGAAAQPQPFRPPWEQYPDQRG